MQWCISGLESHVIYLDEGSIPLLSAIAEFSIIINSIKQIKMRKTLGIIGLERELSSQLKESFDGLVLVHDYLPKYVVNNGKLFLENPNGVGFKPVDMVVFHGIFENDFDLITALTFWGGPCFPNPMAMMNCRLKLPCLARALQVTDFGAPRGMIPEGVDINTKDHTVGKWGNWHCGENKHHFVGRWKSSEVAVLEPYFEGEAIRVIIVGDQALQIKMAGEDWLKSIHSPDASLMELDEALHNDTVKLKNHFGLEIIANDYIVAADGNKYLLEVNHIPNVTRFQELQDIYLEEIGKWISSK